LSPPKTIDKEELKEPCQEIEILPNKKTSVIFQFLYQPEYIGVGNNLIINMDTLKAFGKITQLIPEKIDEAIINTEPPETKFKVIPEMKVEESIQPPIVTDTEQVNPEMMAKDLSKITEKQESND